MAITDTQKVDYLWKKIGYGRAKTDVNSVKNATNESISSPLLLRGEEVWSQSYLIPSLIPGSSTNEVTVYPTSSPVECTADITSSTNRTWKTGTVDWIPPEIGSTYLIKVYLHTAGDAANAASSGTQIFGAGSGNNDEWFFDYKSGVLNFIGTNLPSGISGKSIYISGAVYTGIKGVPVPGSAVSFTDVSATGIATFLQGLESSDIQIGVTTSNEINTLTSDLIIDSATGQTIIDDDLKVTGVSTFIGNVTFEGGTINLGDSDNDNINVSGQFVSNLVPNTDNLYDIGITTQRWRNAQFAGIITASHFDGDLNELGNTYYVASTGSDLNSGNNINEPFLTVAQALSVATNGDIVNISAGTFTETCPLLVPRGVTVKGAGLRATAIKPSEATKQNDIFQLNDVSTIEDITIRDSFYDSSNDTGYAFAYATGIAITTRSPYIQRVTVLNFGSVRTSDDPYGYDTADSPPTSYVSGRGAKVDGSLVASNSLEAGMLFNEVTFFTPNNKGIVATNGARIEYLNCFNYFASQAVIGIAGTGGIGGTADAKLKFNNPSISPSTNDVVKLFEGGTAVAIGTITSYSGDYARIDGKGFGAFTSVGVGNTQDVRFFQSDGTTQTGTADAITLADYKMFGAEMRSIGCAFQYGDQGVVADGLGVELRLFSINFNHIGSGKDFSNDSTVSIQANEITELNDGKISFVSVDQDSNFRVGDSFVINQDTGAVSFAATSFSLDVTGDIDVTDGTNTSNLSPTSLTVGTLRIAADTLLSTSGDININPAGSNETNVEGNLNVSGILTASVLQVSAVQKGDTSIAIDDTGSNGTIRLNTDGVEALRISNSQFVGIGSADPTKTLDVLGNVDITGETQFIGGVTVSGVSTFSSNVIINAELDVTTLDVSGNADIDGHTELDDLNVSGISTFAGKIDANGIIEGIAGQNKIPFLYSDLVDLPSASDYHGMFAHVHATGKAYYAHAGNWIELVNRDTSGNVSLPNNLDVDGHTELDDLNVSGVSTFASNIDANGDLDVDGHTELDNLNVSGVSTFTSNIDVSANLDVTGGTNLDNLNVSGVSTFNGNVIIGDNFAIDTVDFNAAIASHLAPSNSNTYDLGMDPGTKWRNLYLNGKVSAGGSITGTTLYVNGYSELDEVNISETLSVAGIATFTSDVDLNSNLDVDGYTELDEVNISETLSVAGISTFSSAVDLNSNLDVDGYTELDEVNVSETLSVAGIATFTSAVDLNSNLDVDGYTELDEVNISQTLSVAGVATFSSNVNLNGDLDLDGGARIDNVQIGVSGLNEIDTSTGNLTLDSSGGTVIIDDGLSVVGVTTFNALVDANAAAHINDLRLGTSANNEIETSAGNLVLDSASGMVYVDDDLTVAGSLFVQGSTTQVDTNSITVEDRTIELGIVNGSAPSSATTWDLGVLFNYNDGSAKKAAVAWESSVSRFVFGSQVADGGGTGTSNPQLTYTAYAPVEIAALWVNDCAGQSQVISCTAGERHLENITIDGGSF